MLIADRTPIQPALIAPVSLIHKAVQPIESRFISQREQILFNYQSRVKTPGLIDQNVIVHFIFTLSDGAQVYQVELAFPSAWRGYR
jgi:hypothetical protein